MKKRYALNMYYPTYKKDDIPTGGRKCLGTCLAESLEEAIQILNTLVQLRMDKRGYRKVGEISYVIGECI